MPDTTKEQAEVMALRLKDKFAVILRSKSVLASMAPVRIGVASWPADATTVEKLIEIVLEKNCFLTGTILL